MILVDVFFLILDLCCLMRYATTQLCGGSGKHGNGGGDGIEVLPLYCSGIWHIVGLVGSSLCVHVAYCSV